VRTLILGLGNPILGDDAVGLRTAEAVRQQIPPAAGIEVDIDYWGGLRLMERLAGYDRALIIDAICTGAHAPGTILHLTPDDLPTRHSASAHDVDLPTALRLAAAMGLKMPEHMTIIAVEAGRVLDFDESLTPEVAAAIPAAVAAVLESLRAEEDI
jgi:hydrogenase maturation protease